MTWWIYKNITEIKYGVNYGWLIFEIYTPATRVHLGKNSSYNNNKSLDSFIIIIIINLISQQQQKLNVNI